MAAIDDRRTVTKTAVRPIHGSGRAGRVACAARCRRRLRLSGRSEHADASGATRQTDRIRTILPRHEQGGIFAAEGYARATGKPGVVMATSGPGALNLVTGLADAKMDSVPLIAVTGQVPRHVIGTDAFQETPMVEVSRAITKHHYLVQDARDIARIVREAFHLARTGRPGPVLIDVPKDVQNTVVANPVYDVPMDLPGYRLPPPPSCPQDRRSPRGHCGQPQADHLLRRRGRGLRCGRGAARVCDQDRNPRRHDRPRARFLAQ